MERALADLIRISRGVGRDSSLVQGGGGNTSVKTADGRYMYIKASGTAIKDISEKQGWRRLRVGSVCAILDDESLAELGESERESEIVRRLELCCDDKVEGEARPSVEAHLHGQLGRCVVHLHPVAVGAYVCARNGRAQVAQLFGGEKLPPLWVPSANPGYMLAAAVRRLVREYEGKHGRPPSVLFLGQHGLFVTGESAAGVVRRVREVVARCQARLPRAPAPRARQPARDDTIAATLGIRRAVWEAMGKHQCVKHRHEPTIAAFMARPDARRLTSRPSIMPDELVYANGSPLWLEEVDPKAVAAELRRQMARGEKPAASFVVKGVGLLAVGGPGAVADVLEVAHAALQIRGHAAGLGGLRALTKRQREFILNWEAESFRKRVAGLAGEGELAGRIAVVSGAGSGLGRSIAIGLAAAGAAVGLADIDAGSASETAGVIGKRVPRAAAMALPCDVTDERSVDAALDGVLEQWGGLDILVNAAGIAPAYELVHLPVDRWRAALEVNLTGYFLMGRAAARIMIAQGMGGSIINLSSKSGLEASRSNTAYNATKAGEIHMARGWALELGEHGIRVNSVAPGNVFEGSRIWNPQYIRECAKKYGIKPEEVIPFYIDRTALKRDIKGQDVADAVVFLCSDRARTITGQTLVPDSGQVMVR